MELNFDKTKVLLIDDDENYGFALKTLLGTKGLQINSFTNPQEGLEYLKNEKVDMILLDYYMPQMTGEEFLRKLRDFDKTTIVFLQTAFSEEKPELEMLESLNIQGYIDKNKDPNDIFLDIASGIKMAELIKIIKEKEKQIQVLNYKKSIVGDLISHLVNESKDQLFQISGMNDSIKNDTDKYEKQINGIKDATDKIYSLYEALNFENEVCISGIKLKNILSELLKAKLLLNSTKMKISINEGISIKNADKVIYIILKIVDDMIKNNEKEINITSEENKIIVKGSIGVNNIDIEELKILKETEEIKIEKDSDKMIIYI